MTILGSLAGTSRRRLRFDEDRFDWFVVALLFAFSLNSFRNTISALLWGLHGARRRERSGDTFLEQVGDVRGEESLHTVQTTARFVRRKMRRQG